MDVHLQFIDMKFKAGQYILPTVNGRYRSWSKVHCEEVNVPYYGPFKIESVRESHYMIADANGVIADYPIRFIDKNFVPDTTTSRILYNV